MNTANGQCSLFLIPVNTNVTLNSHSSLASLLSTIGFISKKIDTEDIDHRDTKQDETDQEETLLRFFTGDNFLNFVNDTKTSII